MHCQTGGHLQSSSYVRMTQNYFSINEITEDNEQLKQVPIELSEWNACFNRQFTK
jgi:hypothetical protein